MKRTRYYRLDTPVQNPKPDRRSNTTWTTLPFFPPSLYRLDERVGEETERSSIRRISEYQQAPWGTLHEGDPGYQELLAALVPTGRTIAILLDQTSFPSRDVLRRLVESGVISYSDVEDATGWLNNTDPDDKGYDPTTDRWIRKEA